MRRWWAVAGFVIVALVVGVCVSCSDSDRESWAPTSHQRDRGGDDRSDGKDSDGKCQGARQCQDDDFSPSFDDSPVILCLPSSTCNFGGGTDAPGDGSPGRAGAA